MNIVGFKLTSIRRKNIFRSGSVIWEGGGGLGIQMTQSVFINKIDFTQGRNQKFVARGLLILSFSL